jgi:hypothetical protein
VSLHFWPPDGVVVCLYLGFGRCAPRISQPTFRNGYKAILCIDSAIVFTVHADVAHIAEEEVRMQECNRLLLDYGGGLGRVREEISTSINVAALHHL